MRLQRGFFPVVLAIWLTVSAQQSALAEEAPIADAFLQMVVGDFEAQNEALRLLEARWETNFVPMALEAIYLGSDSTVRRQLFALLERKTGKAYGFDMDAWYLWLWGQEIKAHPEYATFKSNLYRLIDPRFGGYFSAQRKNTVRLDEVRWGGVAQDGIPPLRSPKMIPAKKADYLDDDNIVFGLEINGDVRAYPKRILAWHEMFVDRVGRESVAGVYCTLCGTMILYKTMHKGMDHALGTSGFLYRSNKLMYDRATQSLWNTLFGEPVIGPLVGKGIRLERLSVVTTTWGEWRKRHPQTQVLSLNTGFVRDYSEGAAYREYFATDELMFSVPKLDNRLKNKDEVLGLVFPRALDQPLAISSAYLRKNPLYADRIGSTTFVVLTDNSGAHRVYETRGEQFVDWDRKSTVKDSRGRRWTLTEDALTSPDGARLTRLPSHNAFWFGWYSAYEKTRLVY